MNAADTQIRDKLLEGRPLTQAEETRVAEEPELRRLRETLAAFATVQLPMSEPPAALDAAVLQHARKRTRGHMTPLLMFARVALAAAAVLAVVFTVRVYLTAPDTTDGTGTVTVAISTPTVNDPAIEPGVLSWEGDAVDLVLLEVQSQLESPTLAGDPEMRQLIEALL